MTHSLRLRYTTRWLVGIAGVVRSVWCEQPQRTVQREAADANEQIVGDQARDIQEVFGPEIIGADTHGAKIVFRPIDDLFHHGAAIIERPYVFGVEVQSAFQP